MEDAHIEAVEPVRVLDQTDGFTNIRGVHETNQWRRIHLIIDRKSDDRTKDCFRLRVQSDLFDAFEDEWEADIPLTPELLWGVVQRCRQKWHDEAVFFKEKEVYVLQQTWDFSREPQITTGLLPKLAIAGSILFQKLFSLDGQGGGPEGDKLRKIGRKLADLSRKHSLWIRVTSDEFYAPWNLIYSASLRVDGSDAEADGFWGYKHLVEHVPRTGCRGNELCPNQPLQVALQLDEGIDSSLGVQCNVVIENLLKAYDLSVIPRNRSDILAMALRTAPLLDQVLYFCCHATSEGGTTKLRIDDGYLELTDKQHITTGDLDFWMATNQFEHGPVVFLNACEAAQMNSVFYQGFARTFLSRRASAVIGPQTEIPAVFAGEFARAFLEQFFAGGRQNQIGQVLFRLRREFLGQHKNPLGLVYSVYRGADVFLPNPATKKSSN